MHWTRQGCPLGSCFWYLSHILQVSTVRKRFYYEYGDVISVTFYLHFMADYSIILLIKGGNLSGTNSYQSLVRSTFGLPGFLILSGLQFLYPFIGKLFKVELSIITSHGPVLLCLIKATVFALFLSWCWRWFVLQLWSATTSQQVTHWPKYFSEYQEVRCIWFIPHQIIVLNKMWSSCTKELHVWFICDDILCLQLVQVTYLQSAILWSCFQPLH